MEWVRATRPSVSLTRFTIIVAVGLLRSALFSCMQMHLSLSLPLSAIALAAADARADRTDERAGGMAFHWHCQRPSLSPSLSILHRHCLSETRTFRAVIADNEEGARGRKNGRTGKERRSGWERGPSKWCGMGRVVCLDGAHSGRDFRLPHNIHQGREGMQRYSEHDKNHHSADTNERPYHIMKRDPPIRTSRDLLSLFQR